jgi:peroxiredoxin
MIRSVLLLGPLFCACFLDATRAEADKSPIDRKAENFSLKDHRGQEYSLDDLKDEKLVVVAFVGAECPLARLYASRLQKLADEFQPKGVAFLAINSNCQDAISELAAYAKQHGLKMPLLKDVGNRVADQLGAVRTPEVFVLDEKRVVRYWGRIDDQYGIGYTRDKPTRHDLKISIEELLAGKEVSRQVTETEGCFIGRVREAKADAKITYSNQIARIFQNRCVDCHRQGDIGPFELTKYEEVVGWADTIAEVVREERMPPWHADPKHGKFANERRLSVEEKTQILRWVADGAPQGDPKDMPPLRKFVSGWQLPREPDAVFHIREKPVDVPATGEVRYQYFQVDPGFKEDKWFTAAEILPTNREVVHHVLVFARSSSRDDRLLEGGVGGYLVGFVPGLRPQPLPDGMAKRIPAGSKLVFQVHYTPNGKAQQDRTKIGFVFADPTEIKQEVVTVSAAQRFLRIPANEPNYRTQSTSRSRSEDVLLLGMMPHMHVRGKSFSYEARYPDGRSEMLLDVPRYDFNWQTSYRLAEPKKLPAGTRLHCVAHFDNSERNFNNPNPKATVRWGDQTWEEMMIGYFDIAVARDPAREAKDKLAAKSGGGSKEKPSPRAKELLDRLDTDGDGKLARDEVPEQVLRLFDRLDRNGDKIVTLEELSQALGRLGDGP